MSQYCRPEAVVVPDPVTLVGPDFEHESAKTSSSKIRIGSRLIFLSLSPSKDAQQLSIGSIVTQLPEHHAAQALAPDVVHLGPHRLRTVIAPEAALMPERAGYGLLIIIAVCCRQGFQLAITDGVCRAARRLVKPVAYVLYSTPAFTVKGNAED